MNQTYIIQQIGTSVILFNGDADPIESPYFLLGLTDPCETFTKYAIIEPDGCNENWRLSIVGVAEPYEDLPGGIIYFGEPGTWKIDFFVQDNDSNLDPANAILLDEAWFQVRV